MARSKGLQPHELTAEDRAALSHRFLQATEPSFEVAPGSDRALDRIELVAYDPEWPRRFEAWRQQLATALGATARRIDHFGSTSIPGMPAKPVIDIQIRVDDMAREELYVPQIEALGVQLRSRDDDHRFFRPFAGRPRDVHIHVCNLGSEWARKDLLFAAYLRHDAAARAEYLWGKQLAAERWADDRIAYTEAKTEVVKTIAVRAEQWARDVGWKP
ncbi:MAG TPA: GrpB family protein [Candidatus Dormibacteraeota bacterium]|nr:GrpB family protein [Candidatus Dormibacteraeota bacterium]